MLIMLGTAFVTTKIAPMAIDKANAMKKKREREKALKEVILREMKGRA